MLGITSPFLRPLQFRPHDVRGQRRVDAEPHVAGRNLRDLYNGATSAFADKDGFLVGFSGDD